MANYLLLRNNRESGPFSLDDIIELGLKPYDLIWVQGKSAAWRYASEVEELKSIAPAVEEQPFDRFFKKTEEKKELPVVSEEPLKQEPPVIKPEYEKYIPKKSVYVTMPGQKNAAAKEPIKETLPVTPVQPTITISENPAAAQVKYSQPLDDIKEMYVKTLQDRKQKIARKSFWLKNLKKAAALLSLVAAGLIAGYFMKSNNGGKKEIAFQSNATQALPEKKEPIVNATDTVTINNPGLASNTNTQASPSEQIQPLHQPTGGYVNRSPHERNRTAGFNNSIDKPANNNLKTEILNAPSENKTINNLSLVPPQNVDMDASTGERNRKVRNASTENVTANTTERKSVIPGELSGLVSVKSNDYKKVAFGGIRDLQLTVTNESKFILENVTVELQYIKPNELPLKTENIQFTSIAPNAASTIRVSDTNRGIKVVFRIINVKKRPDERVADN